MKPLLALKCPKAMKFQDFLGKIQWPQLATPKIDFLRVFTDGDAAIPSNWQSWPLCRSLLPVPNVATREKLAETILPWVDGELGAGKTFNEGQSAIMTYGGTPDFTYYAFDFAINSGLPYEHRILGLQGWVPYPAFVKKLIPIKLSSISELLVYEEEQLALGAEGVMLRPPSSGYDTGYSDNRATFKKPWLVAIKRMDHGEAEVIGMYELERNTNEQQPDLFGRSVRSSHKAGMVPGGTLGGLIVKDLETGKEFRVGGGFTSSQRDEYWQQGSGLVGKVIRYKWQRHGTKDKPRIPIFEGFRDVRDMS